MAWEPSLTFTYQYTRVLKSQGRRDYSCNIKTTRVCCSRISALKQLQLPGLLQLKIWAKARGDFRRWQKLDDIFNCWQLFLFLSYHIGKIIIFLLRSCFRVFNKHLKKEEKSFPFLIENWVFLVQQTDSSILLMSFQWHIPPTRHCVSIFHADRNN